MVPFLDLTRQYKKIKGEILSATQRVYEKGRFILGEEVSAFEKEFSHYCGVRYGVGVGSGTDALYLALKAAGIGEGDEVITVANSFVATALAISFTGAKPLFVDIDPKTYTMDPNHLELLLKHQKAKGSGRKIKAILPVHLYGHPAEMDSIMEIADRYDLIVIEDACQAHGAKYGKKKVGSFGAMGCFSFYPTKNLGGYGDGGMVVTNDERIANHVKLLRSHGSSPKNKYKNLVIGTNSRLDTIQAAILNVKINHLNAWIRARQQCATYYNRELSGICEITTPSVDEGASHTYHQYTIRVKRRDELKKYLDASGIPTMIYYPTPLHKQPALQNINAHDVLPIAELTAREVLSIPLYPELKRNDQQKIIKAIKSFYNGK